MGAGFVASGALPGYPRGVKHGARWWAGLLAGVDAAWLGSIAVLRHLAGGSGIDLAIFHAALGSLAQGHPPYADPKGFGYLIFGDHFHPIIVVGVPFLWIWNDATMLLLLQAGVVAWTTWLLTQDLVARLGRNGLALAIAFAFSWGLQGLATFDWHEVVFAGPLLVLCLRAFLDGRWGHCAAWALALLLVKEDMVLLVLGLALALALKRRFQLALLTGALACAWELLVVLVIVPALNPLGAYQYRQPTSAPIDGVRRVAGSLYTAFVNPAAGTGTALVMVAAVGFLALRSPLIWTVVLPWLARSVRDNNHYNLPVYHYWFLAIICLVYASAEVMTRDGYRPPRWWRSCVLVTAFVSAVAGPASYRMALLEPDQGRAIRDVVAHVPAGEPVVAEEETLVWAAQRGPATLLRTRAVDELERPVVVRCAVIRDPQTATAGSQREVQQQVWATWAEGRDVVYRNARYGVLCAPH